MDSHHRRLCDGAARDAGRSRERIAACHRVARVRRELGPATVSLPVSVPVTKESERVWKSTATDGTDRIVFVD